MKSKDSKEQEKEAKKGVQGRKDGRNKLSAQFSQSPPANRLFLLLFVCLLYLPFLGSLLFPLSWALCSSLNGRHPVCELPFRPFSFSFKTILKWKREVQVSLSDHDEKSFTCLRSEPYPLVNLSLYPSRSCPHPVGITTNKQIIVGDRLTPLVLSIESIGLVETNKQGRSFSSPRGRGPYFR